jgi:hypothetical protein
MAQIAGENSVPLGVSGSGAAYVLNSREPNALALLQQGERARALAAQRQAATQAKLDQENAKAFNDAVKFKQDGSPYFSGELNNRVYGPLTGRVTEVFKSNRGDLFARNAAAAPILRQAEMETLQSEGKTKYINDEIRTLQADDKLYDADYAGKKLSAALRNDDGTGRLPSEFDAEGWRRGLTGDHNLYKEPEVVRRATEKLMPIITQRVAEAGSIGGQHTAEQVRGRFVAFDGKGHPILNKDGSPKLNLTEDTQTLLESDPLFKLKVDAREAAYNTQREADPTLPKMSRRGHISKMIGPLAFYDEREDAGLNALLRAPRERKADPKQLVATPAVSRQFSPYDVPGTNERRTNHYASVGKSLGTASGPGIQVEANNGQMMIVGQNGEVTRPNTPTANGRVPVQLLSRDYVLYANGKRIGRDKPFQTDEEAHQDLLRIIRESPHPEKLELRVEGRAVVKDKTRTEGDGLGGTTAGLRTQHYDPTKGKMVNDAGPTERQQEVMIPITQEIDAQLRRASGNKYEPRTTSDYERQIINAVKGRGGRLVTPYSAEKPTLAPASKLTSKPAPPAWLKPAAATTKGSKPATKPNKAADLSGGMLD